MNIIVIGAGYVGLSSALLLSKNSQVYIVDIDSEKVNLINRGISPIKDRLIESYFNNNRLEIHAFDSEQKFRVCANYIIIAVPTNFDNKINKIDTSNVEDCVCVYKKKYPDSCFIIKSTVPVGFTEYIGKKYNIQSILYCPEFLREDKSLHDSLYPSRFVLGCDTQSKKNLSQAKKYVGLLKKVWKRKNVECKYMNYSEAEAVKLFSNTYLALRISYFNELDAYAEKKNLNSREIIEGVCLDPRIGNYYNNPSFGYGGYCLPKDTKGLLTSYFDIPQCIIEAIVRSNNIRMDYIAKQILRKKPSVIGVYRLVMKRESDNFRESSVLHIINKLSKKNIKIIIYEPLISPSSNFGYELFDCLDEFAQQCDIIIANRVTQELEPYMKKVYSRDIFGNN